MSDNNNTRINTELGYFGNIWVRQTFFERAGDTNGEGHKHKFDHVSLLTHGKVKVEIEGHPPKEFTAPTFIVIRKEHKHKITALEHGTVWYCVFALRNVDGEVVEDLYDISHDPMTTNIPSEIDCDCSSIVSDDYFEKQKILEDKLEKLEHKTVDET
jgi:hypothetical protein